MATAATAIQLSNGIALDLFMADRSFVGIGEVGDGETVLRRASPPMAPEIRSPDAVEFVDYEVAANGIGPEGGELELRPKRRSAGLMEWMVHEVRNRYRVEDWSQPPQPAEDTRLWLVVRPVTRSVDGIICRGFSYQYRYRSASVPIYKVLDRGSWEIGGTSVGNEIWQRGSFASPIARIERSGQRYSTEWYQPGAVNPNVFQFLPLQTQMQGFTFTVAEAGALITWSPKVSHIRTLIEKQSSCDAIFHLHEHCGDLTQEFETAPMEALWAPGRRDRVANINLYEAVREMVSEALHGDIGMRPERVVPYGVIEEWGPADFERYTRLGVPKLLAAGAKRIFQPNHFANNMNTYGVSNMCCTVDYVVPESVGEANLRAFCDAVHAGGGQVEMWGNTAISTLTFILDRRNGNADRIRFLPREGGIMEAYAQTRDAWARNPSGAIEADHYTPVFAVTNLRDPIVRAYWLRRWREARERVGLDGIFLDSSFNLSSDKFHWLQYEAAVSGAQPPPVSIRDRVRPECEPPAAIRSLYRAHLDLMVEMQRMGYTYSGEDRGVFGVHRAGPPATTRLDNLFLWPECLATFDPAGLREAGADPDSVFFQALAFRMMWNLHWLPDVDEISFHHGKVRNEEDRPTRWHCDLLRVFARVNDAMRRRTVLAGGAGVLYQSDAEGWTLWAFRDLTLDFPCAVAVEDVTEDATLNGPAVHAQRHHVYRGPGRFTATIHPAGSAS